MKSAQMLAPSQRCSPQETRDWYEISQPQRSGVFKRVCHVFCGRAWIRSAIGENTNHMAPNGTLRSQFAIGLRILLREAFIGIALFEKLNTLRLTARSDPKEGNGYKDSSVPSRRFRRLRNQMHMDTMPNGTVTSSTLGHPIQADKNKTRRKQTPATIWLDLHRKPSLTSSISALDSSNKRTRLK